ncbi:hypothetical protein CEXT_319521 [Caerostris extrusa]|uniref:Uncharacterized protein n=1 Tax=Caerostris extrusa TaxID=172846 RepID=A0AAV4UL52_CAEEX|nr:hypothetical protein CEXT_319521 [Caerostris extrusa]
MHLRNKFILPTLLPPAVIIVRQTPSHLSRLICHFLRKFLFLSSGGVKEVSSGGSGNSGKNSLIWKSLCNQSMKPNFHLRLKALIEEECNLEKLNSVSDIFSLSLSLSLFQPSFFSF